MMDRDKVGDLLRVDGYRALVTGGSNGMGRAIALALAEFGADVAVQYLGRADTEIGATETGEGAADQIMSLGRRGYAIDADLGDPGAADEVFARAQSALGQIDILVLAAAIQFRTAWEKIPSDQLYRQVKVNFAASLRLMQLAVPAMAERGWGRVLSIGSTNQVCPRQDLAVYAALKSAQHNLIMNLAKQYGRAGVTFNTLAPGLVVSSRNIARRRDAAAWQAITAGENPMGRAGQPIEIAGAALLFCSPASSYITGTNLFVDGGGHLPDRL
jgi:NAD(P)-dependent dehydrogenase (short-subunit alcohol dehydrogenase family)